MKEQYTCLKRNPKQSRGLFESQPMLAIINCKRSTISGYVGFCGWCTDSNDSPIQRLSCPHYCNRNIINGI